MLPAQPIERLAGRLRAASLHVSEASLNALNRLDAFQKLLMIPRRNGLVNRQAALTDCFAGPVRTRVLRTSYTGAHLS